MDRYKWRFTVTMVMNLRVPHNVENSLTSCEKINFSRRTLIRVFIFWEHLGNTDIQLQKCKRTGPVDLKWKAKTSQLDTHVLQIMSKSTTILSVALLPQEKRSITLNT